MAVRPSSFSRLRCWAGRELVVEHDRVGVDRLATARELLGLALADVGGRVGRVAALHDPGDLVGAGGVDEQGQLVERWPRCRPRRGGGRVTPTSTMRSRKARSMRPGAPPTRRRSRRCDGGGRPVEAPADRSATPARTLSTVTGRSDVCTGELDRRRCRRACRPGPARRPAPVVGRGGRGTRRCRRPR